MAQKICKKYTGNCTVKPEFCARRYYQTIMYPIECGSSLCKECETGIAAYKKLKDKLNLGSNRIKIKKNDDYKKKKRNRKGQSPYSPHFVGSSKDKIETPLPVANEKQTLYDLEILLKAQISYIFALVHEGRLHEALKRIKVINNELNKQKDKLP